MYIVQVNGSVIIIPTVGINGASRNSRYYYSSSSSGTYTDPNRVWPGTELGAAVSQTNYKLWQALTRNGTAIDAAIDLHTPSTGGNSGLWCYADWAVPEAKRLSELIGADTLKVDPGEPGSLETTFVEAGIPAITLEIARAKVWQEEYIQRSYDFVLRALAEWQIIPRAGVPPIPQEVDTYAGEAFASVVPSTHGGFYKPLVKVLDYVEEGQLVGHLYNLFGDRIFNYTAPAEGVVHNVNGKSCFMVEGRKGGGRKSMPTISPSFSFIHSFNSSSVPSTPRTPRRNRETLQPPVPTISGSIGNESPALASSNNSASGLSRPVSTAATPTTAGKSPKVGRAI